jgi:hypothetical protein
MLALLEAAAARPVPGSIRLGLVADRSRLGARPRDLAPAIVLRPRRHDRRAHRVVALSGVAAAAGVLVLAGTLTGVVGGVSGEEDPALSAVIDTVVVLPGGSTVEGARGLVLPEGALIRTGPHGRAVAGGVELGPGLEAVVEAGELVRSTVAQAAPAAAVIGADGRVSGARLRTASGPEAAVDAISSQPRAKSGR